MFLAPCIAIQLCNVNQQNTPFKLMFYFNSSYLLHVSNILCSSSGRLYCTYMQFYMVYFPRIYASNVAGWRMCGFSNLS